MELNFTNVLAGTRCLPKSFYDTDDFLATPPRFIQLTNESLIRTKTNANQKVVHSWGLNLNSKSVIGTIARFAAAFFMLPLHASFGTVYHLLCAITRITMAFVGKSRNLGEVETRRDAFHGSIHLVTAVYNLAITLLSPLVAIVYAVIPDVIVDFHKKVYSETAAKGDHEEPLVVEGTDVQDQVPAGDSYICQAAQSITDAIMPIAQEKRGFFDRLLSPFKG